ncbi:hypothetical protein C9374_008323 [Naegleria lovaniensis]|uniref:Uncharacterized protein n=1 Tax=Naegleria lovaniensis TaxID=51637 RepID=A0AA88GJE9_NAELO|nr:uncharacterized protein C9374_008323 [Naegleria lovaniensis]KAG2378180.1 hypothetical protein C9374_008323 [Naegleria lovaniensis]
MTSTISNLFSLWSSMVQQLLESINISESEKPPFQAHRLSRCSSSSPILCSSSSLVEEMEKAFAEQQLNDEEQSNKFMNEDSNQQQTVGSQNNCCSRGQDDIVPMIRKGLSSTKPTDEELMRLWSYSFPPTRGLWILVNDFVETY